MANPDRSSRPNVLVVVADDHRADCLGGDRVTGPATPTLDALARRGTQLENARISGGHNPAVCVPSRAALMTGCAPHQALSQPRSDLIAESQRIREDLTTLGEAFRQAGYITHAVGKWHNDPGSLARGFAGGSRLFLDGMSAHQNPRLQHFDPGGRFPVETARETDGFSTDIFADGAVEFLQQREPGDEPFLLYLAFTSPHDPRTPLSEYRQHYDSAAIQLPDNYLAHHPFDNGELQIRDEMLADFPRTPSTIREHLADYYALIEHHDHAMGRVLQALAASGEENNTIVVYTSDHGLAIGSHGLLGKQNLYEHSLKVPVLIAGPGIPPNHLVQQNVPAYGLFPTLCELCGIPIPATVESTPFTLRGRTASPGGDTLSTPCFSHYRDVQRAVNLGHWKLIQYRVDGAEHQQLFDLQTDPSELHNLADNPSCQERVKELSALLEAWWAQGPGATAEPLGVR